MIGLGEKINNIRGLIQSGKGPLATFVDVCHEEGMGIFGSVRMNSHYAEDPSSPRHSEFRLKHPEWLIGHPPGLFQRQQGIWNPNGTELRYS